MEPKDKDSKKDQPAKSMVGIRRVIASSFAPPPGHWRGGFFWPSGQLVSADVDAKQFAAISADPRLQVVDPEAPIPTAQEMLDRAQEKIRAEARKIAEERDRIAAAEKLRKNTEKHGYRYSR